MLIAFGRVAASPLNKTTCEIVVPKTDRIEADVILILVLACVMAGGFLYKLVEAVSQEQAVTNVLLWFGLFVLTLKLAHNLYFLAKGPQKP